MLLFFVDTNGRQGRITDEFAVHYDGSLPVEKYVREVVTETASADRAVEELIIGMVADLDVDEVQRDVSATTSPRPPA